MQMVFLHSQESTVQAIRTKVEVGLKIAVLKSTTAPKALLKYQSKTERPLLLGNLDSMVQRYLLAASNWGAVLTRASAVSATKALLNKCPNAVANVDLESSSWAKSL